MRRSLVIALLILAVALTACGSSSGSSSNPDVVNGAGTTVPASVVGASSASSASTSSSSSIVNVWKNPGSVKLTALPLGDNKESTTMPAVGMIYVCMAGNPNGPGSRVNGPWIHGTTWDETEKTVVQ